MIPHVQTKLDEAGRFALLGRGPRAIRLRTRITDDLFMQCITDDQASVINERIAKYLDLSRFVVPESEKSIVSQAFEQISVVRILSQQRSLFQINDKDPVVLTTKTGTFTLTPGTTAPVINFTLNLDEMSEFIEAKYNLFNGFVIRHKTEELEVVCGSECLFKEVAEKTIQLMTEVIEQLWPQYVSFELMTGNDVLNLISEAVIAQINSKRKYQGQSDVLKDSFFGINVVVLQPGAASDNTKDTHTSASVGYDYFENKACLHLRKSFVETDPDMNYMVYYKGQQLSGATSPVSRVCKKIFEESVVKYHDGWKHFIKK